MKKLGIAMLSIMAFLFCSSHLLASPSEKQPFSSVNLTVIKKLKEDAKTGQVALPANQQRPKIVLLPFVFTTSCGGIQVTCGWVLITYNDVDNTIWGIESFSACDDPHICDGVFGWG